MCLSGKSFSLNISDLASGLCSNNKLNTVSVYRPAALSRLESVDRSPTTYLVANCRRQLCRHLVTHVYLFATYLIYI